MTESDGNKHFPSDDWEKIYIKPSIDLISDEYERETNSNLLVELVRDSDDKEAWHFLEIMRKLGYQINETDIKGMEERVTSSWIDQVLKKVQSKDCDGIIMVFSQVTYNGKVMKDIWTKFTSRECPQLRNKPKIFIFLAPRQPKILMKADSFAFTPKWKGAYETPAEADILIIQDKFVDNCNHFLSELGNYIETYGDKEDIFTLASVSPNSQPLLISTMTRKFYVKLHQYRGHHLNIRSGNDRLKEKMEQMRLQWCEGTAMSEAEKPKRTGSFLSSLRKKFNRKKESRPNIDKVVGCLVAEQGESSEKDRTGKKDSDFPSKHELEEAKTAKQASDKKTEKGAAAVKSPVKKRTPSVVSNNSEKRISKGSLNSSAKPVWKP